MKSTLYFLLATLLLTIGCTSDSPTSVATDSGKADAPAAPVSNEESESAQPAADGDSAEAETASVESQSAEPEADAFGIGSKAPALDIKHWVSNGDGAFSEVTNFEPGKIYLVEFWATWCGPCVASMPHLAETQEKYKDQIQIISVSDEDLDTVTKFLEGPLRSPEEDGPQTYGELTSGYCLTTDPDRSVSKDYMEAAGQNGIPCCFIVGKTGEIEWIGHPMSMDKSLAAIVDGTWDRAQYAIQKEQEKKQQMLMQRIFAAVQAGDADKAKEIIQTAKNGASAEMVARLEEMETQVEMQVKVMPIFEMAQSGDLAGAIEKLGPLIEESDAAVKEKLSALKGQLEQAMKQAEAAQAEATPADDEAQTEAARE